MKAHIRDSKFNFSCNVSNTGQRDGDEVLQVYHRVVPTQPLQYLLPSRKLVDFARLSIHAGSTASITFAVTQLMLMTVDQAGELTLLEGQHEIIFSRGIMDDEQVLVIPRAKADFTYSTS